LTFYDVYIAQSDDPSYTKDDGDWSGNAPAALSPVLYDRNRFHRICDMVAQGELPGKQTDWGCWVVIVDKKQVLDFFKDVQIPRQMAEFLKSLKDSQSYALVAREL